MSTTRLGDEAKEPLPGPPSPPPAEEPETSPASVVEVSGVDESASREQGGHDISPLVEDTASKSHRQLSPTVDIVVKTPKASITAMIPKPDSPTNSTIIRPTTPEQRQTSPDAATLRDAESISPPCQPFESVQDRALHILVAKLTPELSGLLRRAGSQMGDPRTFRIQFDPTVSEIRALIDTPPLTAKDMADLVADIMLDMWTKKCRHTIRRYTIDFRSDLAAEARERIEVIKRKVLFDLLMDVFGDFNFRDKPPVSPPPQRPHTPSKRRVEKTPRTAPIPRGPTHLVLPFERGARGTPTGNQGSPGTPTKSPLRHGTPNSFQRPGMMGRQNAYSRVCRIPPPKFNIHEDDDI
ncbi:hypothetical protein F4678DRAFT_310704 [Xylaria arbuscula]|nr:hypothetical protein F4678DRAFT_310704 [Xylaria arbuscula]